MPVMSAAGKKPLDEKESDIINGIRDGVGFTFAFMRELHLVPHQEWCSNVVGAAAAYEDAVAPAPSRDLERSLGSSRFRCRIRCTASLRSRKRLWSRQSPHNVGTRFIESSFGKALPRWMLLHIAATTCIRTRH